MSQMQTKELHTIFSFKFNEEQRIVSGFGAIMGNQDDGGDIIVNGAFAKTIAENFKRIKLCLLHQRGIPLPIGKMLVLKEVGRDDLPADLLLEYPDATGGLYFEAQISKTRDGLDAIELIKDGVLFECSIGYDAIKWEMKGNVRYLKEIRLWEISLVAWGMNSATRITGYKSRGGNNMETLLEKVMQVKAADLITSMNQAVQLQQLREQRWRLADALWDVTNNIIEDTEMDNAAKVAALSENLEQFKELMLAWFTAYLALITTEGKAAHTALEFKAGRKISKQTREILQKVLETGNSHYEAIGAMKALLDELEPDDDSTSEGEPEGKSTQKGKGAAGIKGEIDPEEIRAILQEVKAFKEELKL